MKESKSTCICCHLVVSAHNTRSTTQLPMDQSLSIVSILIVTFDLYGICALNDVKYKMQQFKATFFMI